MLREQERLGIVRANANTKVLSGDDIESALFNRKIDFDPDATLDEKRQLLPLYSQHRHIQVWHDNGNIAGHGHFLVLVSGIYDPAFYYIEQELQDMGVDVDVMNVLAPLYLQDTPSQVGIGLPLALRTSQPGWSS